MSFRKMLFVCMGNSCSSPMAQAIMDNMMNKSSLYWEIDSAGLRSWNAGRRPHKHCRRVLKEHGLRCDHYSRLFSLQDFRSFDCIIAMNMNVYKELMLWSAHNRSTKHAEVHILSWFSKNGQEAQIKDVTTIHKLKDFRDAYYQIKDCCKYFLVNQRVKFIQYDEHSCESESSGDESISEAYRKHNERLLIEDKLAKFDELVLQKSTA